MGMIRMFSSSSYDTPCQSPPTIVERIKEVIKYKQLPNPDPTNFIIKRASKIGLYLIIEVNYPDCTNYEGNKILVYYNVALKELEQQGNIDPHFSENKKYFSPVARFFPTDAGWNMAIALAITLSKDK